MLHELIISGGEHSYASQIDAILAHPLAPENIESYADDALNNLISVVSAVSANYSDHPTYLHDSTQEREEAAFAYFGLADITSVLDHVASKVNEINALDSVIAHARTVDYVAVPPDDTERQIQSGSGEGLESKKLVSRLKTVLFLLGNEFGVDVSDSSQLEIADGKLTSNMMRKTSYYLLNASKLGRSFLICDEEGNVSYVFDNKYLADIGITDDALLKLSKPELIDLITQRPEVGKRIVYSELFVNNMLNAIDDPKTQLPLHQGDDGSTAVPKPERSVTLAPKPEPAPEGYLTIFGISKVFGVTNASIKKAVSEIISEDQAPKRYRYDTGIIAEGYSPDFIQRIHGHLESTGRLASRPPEGFASVKQIAKLVGVSDVKIGSVIKKLGDQLGDIDKYKFGSIITYGYSPDQIEKIKASTTVYESAPNGFLTLKGISEFVGIDTSVISRAIEELGETICKPADFLSDGSPQAFLHYDSESVAAIVARIDALGILAPGLPGGYKTLRSILASYNLTEATLAKALTDVNIDPGSYRVLNQAGKPVGRPTAAVSAEDFQLLSPLLQSGAYDRPERYDSVDVEDYDYAPEGYESVNKVAKLNGVENSVVGRIINQHSDQLGEVLKYRPRTGARRAGTGAPFWGLSPQQQQFIAECVEAEGYSLPTPPEDYLHSKAMSRVFGVANQTVDRAIVALSDELSAFPARVGSVLTVTFSPTDQQRIHDYLESKDAFATPMPEGYLSVNALARQLGLSAKLVKDAANEIDSDLGERQPFVIGPRAFAAFSPDQQEMVVNHLQMTSRLAPKAPEGVLSFTQLIKSLKVSPKILQSIIDQLDEVGELGEQKMFKFKTVSARGFTTENQARITSVRGSQ